MAGGFHGDDGLLSLIAPVHVQAGERVGRQGDGALPAVAAGVGGKGCGEDIERFAVVEACGNAVEHDVGLSDGHALHGMAGERKGDAVGGMAEFLTPEAQVHAVGFRARFANVGFEVAVGLRFGYRQRVVFARRDFGRFGFGTAAGMDDCGGGDAPGAAYARAVRCAVAGTDTGFQTACGGLGGRRAAVARGGGSGRASAAVPQRRGILTCGVGATCAADGRGMVYRAPEVQGGGIRRCRSDAGGRICRPLRQVCPIQQYARSCLRLHRTHRRICGFVGGK